MHTSHARKLINANGVEDAHVGLLLPELQADVQRETLGSLQECFNGIGMLVYKASPESGCVERNGALVSADVRDVE